MASRILLADDSITIQKVVNLTFADEGIEVVAVSNGDIAERRLAEVSPDLVLADIFMPGKNGYELCEAIKENSQFRNVPVVLLVGAFEPFDQIEARRVRADAHLTKPFESRTLVETVRRLISASWSGAAAPITAPPTATDKDHRQAQDALAPATTAMPFTSPPPVKLDLSAMTTDSNVAPPSVTQHRTTGELGSLAPDASQDVLDLGFVDAPISAASSATQSDSIEPFEPFDLSPNGDFASLEPSTASAASPEMIQDFDKSAFVEPLSHHDEISFETEPSASLVEVDISGAGEGEDWFSRSSFENAQTNHSGDAAWQTPAAAGSPQSYQSSDFDLHSEGTFAASETSNETACGTLLAVDEPLGDVLFDEGVAVGQMSIAEPSSGDALALDFAEHEVAGAGATASTQFDLVESVEETQPEASFGFDEKAGQVEGNAVEETVQSLPIEEISASGDHDKTSATYPPAEVETVSHPEGDFDWTTPRAASYSTAQLDPVVMPIGTFEHPVEQPLVEEAVAPAETESTENPAEEASFSTSTMWTEKEARFTPIDIEAVAVEESAPEEIGEIETGFAVTSMFAEEAETLEVPAATGEVPATELASTSNAETSEASVDVPAATETDRVSSVPESSELSSATIEQIVRRVLAEMSESVVREVAWEVVPDCVERVIEQLTRESLSKRA